jgi:glycosyltransferase involved in cell wall biosynthesis
MKLGLKGSAFFFGQRDGTEMPDWYNACDIFVLPSRDEGLSLSLLEAMSCARPVITAVPAVGCYDAVIDGETGFYFRYGDIHELIEKLNLLIHSEHLRRQIGHNARDLVAKKFAWGKVAEEMLSVFESVLKV